MTFFLFNSRATDDVINVKDFGALGNGSHDDTTAIQAAINAMYASALKSCILFFPPGSYLVTSTINISNNNVGSNFTSGIIQGSGRFATSISGNIGSGFVFAMDDATNGPEEIANLSLVNSSTVIGTGALMYNNSSMRITNCHFFGMVNIFQPYNIFQGSIQNCTGEAGSDPTTGGTGTFGICGNACNVEGWRSASAYQAAMQFNGANTATISGSSAEDCTAGLLAGFGTGWASQCTVSGNVLTVGGTLGTSTVEQKQFQTGAEIFMRGLTTTADWGISPFASTICIVTETNAENPSRTGVGWAGTYTISRSANIASPVPCISRYIIGMSGLTVNSFETEAAYFIIVAANISGCTFNSCGGSSTIAECVNAFGTTGFTANTGFYIRGGCGTTSFVSCAANSNAFNAGWYFDPNGGLNSNFSLINCSSQRLADSLTGTSSSISNGSGGAGTILNVVSYTGTSGPNVGMKVTGAGVTAGTVITRNYTTDTQAISSYSYNSGTGLVTLTMANTQTIPNGWNIAISGLNIPTLNIVTTAVSVSGTTVTYTAPTGQVGSPSGGGTLHTLTGLAGVGTYGVNNSQLVTGTAMTIHQGEDWIIPTSNDGKTGVNLIDCNSGNLPAGYVSGLANGMARTYASLPGNVGSNSNYPVQDGMEYPIIDSNTAVWGATVAGGGSNHVKVRYNGANWTVVGK